MNKKGDERVLSVYLFIIYVIVSIGIVSGVILFYGSPLDVRIAEAGVLNSKIINCLVEKGELKQDLDDISDLQGICNLNFKDNTKSHEGIQYAVNIKLFELNSCSNFRCSNPLKNLNFGEKEFLVYCNAKGSKIPKCNTEAVYVFNEKKILQITSAVNKVENV
tara:strand:- start:1317 stop:1805 length:489 start_codon:yes stop_codon:yes gene_type:complete